MRTLVLWAALAAACTRSNPAYRRAGPDAEAPAVDAGAPALDAAPSTADAGVEDSAAVMADVASPSPPDAPPPDAARDVAAQPEDAPPPADAPATGRPRYDFETSTQGWRDLRDTFYHQPTTPVARSTARAWQGQASLEISIDTMNNYTTPTIGVMIDEPLPAGTRITYHLWFPGNGSIEAVQPYVLYQKRGYSIPQWGGIDPVLFTTQLTPDAWNTVTHVVPADIAGNVLEVGMEWRTFGNQRVKVYMDAISW